MVGHLPLVKISSVLLLPVSLNDAGTAAVALVFSIVCSVTASRISITPGRASMIGASMVAAIAVLLVMAVATPMVAYAFSPESYGQHLIQPWRAFPSFAAVGLPSTICFALLQWRRRVHLAKLGRLYR